jgi:hypothetical protein
MVVKSVPLNHFMFTFRGLCSCNQGPEWMTVIYTNFQMRYATLCDSFAPDWLTIVAALASLRASSDA